MADPKTTPKPNASAKPAPTTAPKDPISNDDDFDAATAPQILCEIQRDYWDENGKRHPKGTQVPVSVEDALDGIESGALKRVKSDD